MFHITVSDRKGITHTVKFTRLLLETGERGIRFPAAVPTTGKNKGKRFPAFSAVAVNPDTGGLLTVEFWVAATLVGYSQNVNSRACLEKKYTKPRSRRGFFMAIYFFCFLK